MNQQMVLASLQRKLKMYRSAGMEWKGELTELQIAEYEAKAAPEQAGTIVVDFKPGADGPRPWLKQYEAEAPAGVDLTPAVQPPPEFSETTGSLFEDHDDEEQEPDGD